VARPCRVERRSRAGAAPYASANLVTLTTPSDKIAELATKAREVCLLSKRHEWYWCNDPRFSKILDPKRIKLAFADEIALKRWHGELNAIILQATAKTPMGSNDDGQEVGKSH
jgi:hypothetical protein